MGLLPASLFAIETTQTLNLSPGWNAVWLEVAPVHTSGDKAGTGKPVAEVFDNPAIQAVATPTQSFGSVEFITDPGEGFFNRSGWRVWHRTSELAANSLNVVQGFRGYLVKTSAAVTLDITGTAHFHQIDWEPNSYNLVGYGLTGAVTFGDFFADASTEHPVNRIFQLDPATGNWEGVRATDTMASGRAYWVFCDGPSDFTGPVKVRFPGIQGIDFGPAEVTVEIPDPQDNTGGTLDVSLRELVLTNVSGRAQTVTVAKALPDSGANSLADDLRLFDVVPTPGTLSYEPGAGLLNETDFAIAPQATTIVTLGAHRNWSSGAAARENLYRLEFEHHYLWLPVTASNTNLSDAVLGTADPQGVGLWVGEVSLRQVTSLTEDGRPLAPTTSSAPLRVILHVDGSGNTHLLSHVMFMQTKTADLTIAPEEVLVLNEAQIPFHEGVEERAGKKAGLRIESTSYDMPRVLSLAAQADLLSNVAFFKGYQDAQGDPDTSQVTTADLVEYVGQLKARDPELEEVYHLKWPLEGTPGLNAIVRTGANPLTLDAFHRSNPFRHAFHPQHGTGRNLSRDLTLSFDDSGNANLLRGVWSETITGLTAAPLTMEGTLTLERLSTTATLAE